MISGFFMVRNGIKYDYPFQESLQSLLPLVDELVVNIGVGEDETLKVVESIRSPKIKILQTRWPDVDRLSGGTVLSEQTNIALNACQGDWCLHLQADEVFHEHDFAQIRHAIKIASLRPEIEALVFDYTHFYGSYDVVQETRSAYRREVRAVKRSSGAQSFGDAQGFRKAGGTKLRALHSGARIFHYGWVRTPEAMKAKTFYMDQLYHGAPTVEQKNQGVPHTGDNYKYKRIWGLKPFKGSHPEAMRARIAAKHWHWDLQNSPLVLSKSDIKKVVLDTFERCFGARLFEYRGYELEGAIPRVS